MNSLMDTQAILDRREGRESDHRSRCIRPAITPPEKPIKNFRKMPIIKASPQPYDHPVIHRHFLSPHRTQRHKWAPSRRSLGQADFPSATAFKPEVGFRSHSLPVPAFAHPVPRWVDGAPASSRSLTDRSVVVPVRGATCGGTSPKSGKEWFAGAKH
jgi:hypothetical protein